MKRQNIIESNQHLKMSMNEDIVNKLQETKKILEEEKSNRYLIKQRRMNERSKVKNFSISMSCGLFQCRYEES